MSTRRTKPGGWVARRKKGACRWCGAPVPKGRFTFCGDTCVHEWRLRTDPGYLREQVFARDRGVCAQCGVDTEALRRDKRKLDYRARKQFEKDWGGRRHLWDADHIVPVVEGGGECDLANMRTLCIHCHKLATAELRRRRRRGADSQSAGSALLPSQFSCTKSAERVSAPQTRVSAPHVSAKPSTDNGVDVPALEPSVVSARGTARAETGQRQECMAPLSGAGQSS